MDLLTWEWRGVTGPALSPLDGSALQNQMDRVAVLQNIPDDELVGLLGAKFSMEVLSGKRTVQVIPALTSEASTRWILTTPHYGRLWTIDPDGEAWLENTARSRIGSANTNSAESKPFSLAT